MDTRPLAFCLLITSLAGACATAGNSVSVTADTPQDDRWYYPFNATPGSRPTGGIFATTDTSQFDYRDGSVIVRWDLDTALPAASEIVACTVTAYATGTSFFTLGVPGHYGIESRLELFGVGYGPTYEVDTWDATDPYVGGQPGPPFPPDPPRDPYPINLLSGAPAENDTSTDAVYWGLGAAPTYVPGVSPYFPITWSVDVSSTTAQTYIREALQRGSIGWYLTSTIEIAGPIPGAFPNLVLSEGVATAPGTAAPSIEIEYIPLASGDASSFEFDTPQADHWHYPFNATPGSRPTGPIFNASPESFGGAFNYRDGYNIVRWDTSDEIPIGLEPSAYQIESCTVTVWNVPTASWSATGVNELGIPNRLELFGVGYGPTYTADTWTDSAAFVGGSVSSPGTARDPYPIHYLSGGHAEDATEAANIAWAIGEPVGYTPDAMTAPFPIVYCVNVYDATTSDYLRQALSAGRVDWIVASTVDTEQEAVGPNPNIVLNEGVGLYPGSSAPTLELDVVLPQSAAVAQWGLYE